jgi:hypothetical protein
VLILGFSAKAVKKKLIGYHFRANLKLDPHHFLEKMLNFSLKSFVNHQISMLQAVVETFTDNNNEYQLRSGADRRTVLQRHKQRNTCIEKSLIVCQKNALAHHPDGEKEMIAN